MRLELQEEKGNKVLLLLDGEAYCRCYRKDLRSAGIAEGEEIGEAALSQFIREILLPRAKRRSLFLLNRKRYTAQEMRKKLTADGYPGETVEETLLYLQELRYIDDVSYAQGYALSLLPQCSEREIYQKMLQRGFEKELITEAIEEAQREYSLENGNKEAENEPPELAAIRTYLRKKGYQPEQATKEKKKKVIAALYRRGFSLPDICKVIGETEGME